MGQTMARWVAYCLLYSLHPFLDPVEGCICQRRKQLIMDHAIAFVDLGSTQYARNNLTGEARLVFDSVAPENGLRGGPFDRTIHGNHMFLNGAWGVSEDLGMTSFDFHFTMCYSPYPPTPINGDGQC